MTDLSKTLPSKIEGTFDLPKVREMIAATSLNHVLQFVEMELAMLSQLVSVGGNLNDAQTQFIAEELVNDYPNETIADFKICFRNGAKGNYGDIYRLDGIIIGQWMKSYLDEKYKILEDQLMKEKDDHYKIIVPENSTRDWLTEWQKSISDGVKEVPDLTDEEIEEEGKEVPKRKVHPFIESEAEILLREHHEKLFRAQELTVRERHPEFSEEQVKARCEELQQQIIHEETRHKLSPLIDKIWNPKKKPNKEKRFF